MDFIKEKLEILDDRFDGLEDKAEAIIKKIKADDDFAEKFKAEPVKTVEKLLGVDLPDEKVKALVAAVKAKIDFEAIGKKLDSDGDGKPDLGALGKLFK